MLTPLEIILYANNGINQFFALVLLCLSVFALVEALRAAPHAYTVADRKTKGFWTAVTGGSVVFAVFALINPAFNSLLIQLIVAVAVGVFLADVRPVVVPRRR